MVPEWAPNLHPMVVHFPIALLFIAVLMDMLSVFWRKHFATTALVLYLLGALGMVAAYLSGQAAADAVAVSGQANVVLATHADWAAVALWYFSAYALLRLALAWRSRRGYRLAVHVPLIIVAVGGLMLIVQTADNGARMVYEFGVGVAGMEEMTARLEETRRELAFHRGQSALPVMKDDGSWHWAPGPYAGEAFAQAFVQPTGSVQVGGARDSAVVLEALRSPALFVLEQDLESVQVDLMLGLEDFEGSVQVVYNFLDTLNYGFAEFSAEGVRLGRLVDGAPSLFAEEQSMVQGGWRQYRVVSDRTHFRAYVGGSMVAHGHGAALEAGSVGLRLQGTGAVLLGWMEATRLR